MLNFSIETWLVLESAMDGMLLELGGLCLVTDWFFLA